MFQLAFRYHPNVQAIACLLRGLQVKVHIQSIEQQLEQHPDWPSLLCISDALHQWQVPHLAAKAADKQLPDTHYPFLAVTNHPERPLAIVTGVNGGRVQYYQQHYNRLGQEDQSSFVQRWTGVYLLAECNAQSGEADYAGVRKKWWLRQALPVAAVLLLMALITGGIWPRLALANGTAALLGTAALALLFAAGLVVSGLLLWYEIDQSNPLLKKVCTGLAKTNCHAILSSNASKLFGWLSWSEVGAAYFAGGLLLLAMSARAPWALQWLGLLGMAALLYPVFSIYYQWRVAKQWCVLCLAVQAILLLQGVSIVIGNLLPAVQLGIITPFLIPHSLFHITTVYLLPLLAWLSIKPLLLRWQTAKREQRAYRRLKFNPEVFTSLLQQQKAMATAPEGLGIALGPADAPHKLVKVCNPYCGPCSKAHPKMEKLLHQHSNLQVQILFKVPNEQDKLPTQAASHLIAIAETTQNEQKVKQALDAWYLPIKKDIEAFVAKFPLEGQSTDQITQIEAMGKWCNYNKIAYTPTIFYNGHELPNEYDLDDLEYFLQE